MRATENEVLRHVLLDLGLEDWIPIPEATGDPEVLETIGDEDVVTALRRALRALVESNQIALYQGHWAADPEPVPTAAAIGLLEDPAWFAFHPADADEQRLWFVIVRNIRS